MIIHPAEQNSLEWLVARAGIVTASEFDQILSPDLKVRTGEMPKTYMAVKMAEKWLGGPLPSFNALDMEFGKILEEEALPFYSLEYGEEIRRVGLLLTDDGKVGASPDGLLGEDGGIEIKCPRAETHVKYLLAGIVPKDYLLQVQGAMYVTGRKWWKFMSYHRRFPPFLLKVERDEKIQMALETALADFLAKFDAGMKRLIEINGGPPIRRPLEQLKPLPQQEYEEMGITP